MTHTSIDLPEDLVQAVDELAGKADRTRFIEEAVRSKIRVETMKKWLEDTEGVFTAEKYPDWATPEKTYAWVRESRRQDNESLERKWRGLLPS
jgi:predicted transcriptional regulator